LEISLFRACFVVTRRQHCECQTWRMLLWLSTELWGSECRADSKPICWKCWTEFVGCNYQLRTVCQRHTRVFHLTPT